MRTLDKILNGSQILRASLDYNQSSSGPGMPNQASPGPNYTVAIPVGVAGDTPIHRKGIITRLDLTNGGAQTANQTFTFGSIAAEGWLDGDTVFISEPAARTGAFTNSIRSIAATALTTWAGLLANGGTFVFKAHFTAGVADGDFVAMGPGVSTI